MTPRGFEPGHEIWMLAPELACESPIETHFLQALRAVCSDIGLTMVVVVGEDGDPVYPVTQDFACGRILYLRPQFKADRFRFDFRLSLFGFDDDEITAVGGPLLVECDGHDYHERTKDQAARDRSKDRTVQEWGWPIFRFTGRELYRNAAGCASQCVDLLLSRLAPRKGQA